MWVIGNGEGRKHVDLSNLKGTKIGCNAICRDYDVDYLICVDRRMAKEALALNYSGRIYTRQDWINEFSAYNNVTTVPELPYKGTTRPDEPFHWGSGPYALLLACTLADEINLIGFDLHSETKFVNNIYKGTKHYNEETYRAVDPRYWIHQIGKLFELYPNKTFKIYQNSNWVLPKAWIHPNVMVDKISIIV